MHASSAYDIGFLIGVTSPFWLVAIYMTPAIVASALNRNKVAAIIVLNLFLGWTVLGWIGALVWAVADSRRAA